LAALILIVLFLFQLPFSKIILFFNKKLKWQKLELFSRVKLLVVKKATLTQKDPTYFQMSQVNTHTVCV
jgi:hypothetical protein